MRLALVLLLSGSVFVALAQISSEEISKSLVKISTFYEDPSNGQTMVKRATGFVWKEKEWVVTSLHAIASMEDEVELQWKDGLWLAKPIKAFPTADLVLLKVLFASGGEIPQWTPLNERHLGRVGEDEQLKTMGYYSDILTPYPKRLSMTRVLPMTHSLPGYAIEKLQALGIPDVNISVYNFHEGNLLPGFSGAPILHSKTGRIVAIADGGLENGMINISWGIPSLYLDSLEQSTLALKEIPTIKNAALLFSASVEKVDENNRNKTLFDSEVVHVGDFSFFKIKTRPIKYLVARADDVQRYTEEINEIKSFYPGCEDLRMDVYQDINHGLILAVPEGEKLEFSDGALMVNIDYQNSIGYFFDKIENDIYTIEEMRDGSYFDTSEEALLNYFIENLPDKSYEITERENRKTNIGAYSTFTIEATDYNGDLAGLIYCKVSRIKNYVISSVSICEDLTQSNLDAFLGCLDRGIDCSTSENTCDFDCGLLEKWMLCQGSVDFTTFDNAKVIKEEQEIVAKETTSEGMMNGWYWEYVGVNFSLPTRISPTIEENNEIEGSSDDLYVRMYPVRIYDDSEQSIWRTLSTWGTSANFDQPLYSRKESTAEFDQYYNIYRQGEWLFALSTVVNRADLARSAHYWISFAPGKEDEVYRILSSLENVVQK